MQSFIFRFTVLLLVLLFLSACSSQTLPVAMVNLPEIEEGASQLLPGYIYADGSRPLNFPEDFGAHPDFRTEWWYYTGNLETLDGRHFGFELTFFGVGILPPSVQLPDDSLWYNRRVYFAHFAVSDIGADQFHAFERYSRPGPGLAGAQGDPYRVWLEDWNVTGENPGDYILQAEQEDIAIELTLTDSMGVVLQGENGYSPKGENLTNASYYYSQPRLEAAGSIWIAGTQYPVSGLVWKDHEFSTSVLDEDQVGWDWFSLQFDSGDALMLFQLRETDGEVSQSSSGTYIDADGTRLRIQNGEFEITVLDQWLSPHSGGEYPSAWEVRLDQPDCLLEIQPWMEDQELNFQAVTYWEGAIAFSGNCEGTDVTGNGYIELTGYVGNVPLP